MSSCAVSPHWGRGTRRTRRNRRRSASANARVRGVPVPLPRRRRRPRWRTSPPEVAAATSASTRVRSPWRRSEAGNKEINRAAAARPGNASRDPPARGLGPAGRHLGPRRGVPVVFVPGRRTTLRRRHPSTSGPYRRAETSAPAARSGTAPSTPSPRPPPPTAREREREREREPPARRPSFLPRSSPSRRSPPSSARSTRRPDTAKSGTRRATAEPSRDTAAPEGGTPGKYSAAAAGYYSHAVVFRVEDSPRRRSISARSPLGSGGCARAEKSAAPSRSLAHTQRAEGSTRRRRASPDAARRRGRDDRARAEALDGDGVGRRGEDNGSAESVSASRFGRPVEGTHQHARRGTRTARRVVQRGEGVAARRRTRRGVHRRRRRGVSRRE